MNCNNNKKTANKGNTSNRGKSLIIVNTIVLNKSFGNKTCLILFNSAIRFDLVDPFIANGRFTTRKINQIPSVSILQNLKFFYHYLLPKKISTCLTIGVRLMKRNHSSKTRIITQMSRRCSYPVRATKRKEISLISDRIHGRCRFLGRN